MYPIITEKEHIALSFKKRALQDSFKDVGKEIPLSTIKSFTFIDLCTRLRARGSLVDPQNNSL